MILNWQFLRYTSFQKFVISNFFNEWMKWMLIQQRCIKLIESDSKDI